MPVSAPSKSFLFSLGFIALGLSSCAANAAFNTLGSEDESRLASKLAETLSISDLSTCAGAIKIQDQYSDRDMRASVERFRRAQEIRENMGAQAPKPKQTLRGKIETSDWPVRCLLIQNELQF